MASGETLGEVHPLAEKLLTTFPALHTVVPIVEQQLGEYCFDQLFNKLNASEAHCVQLLISKAIGYWIVIFGSIVKLPQILKLLASREVTGVSFSSYLLETAASSIFVAYNHRNGNPFSTFGESAFINVQNIIIMLLLCMFKSRHYGMALVFLLWTLSSWMLASASIISDYTLELLSGVVIPLSIFSKLPQILAIIKTGHVRNLSSLTLGAYFAGSLARLYTTLLEVDDKIILTNYALSSILNFILVAQVFYYKFLTKGTTNPSWTEGDSEAQARKRLVADKVD